MLARMWDRIATPKSVTLLTATAYLGALIGGIAALIQPPNTIEGAVGEVAMTILAGFLTLAGALGVPTSLLGIWDLERTAVLLAAISAGIYLGVVLGLHYTSDGNRLLQGAMILIALAAIITRGMHIWHRPRAPREERIAAPPGESPLASTPDLSSSE